MDTRWRDLPHTDTHFTPRQYHDLEEWEGRRAHLRRQILWAAGLWPMPERTPLNPQFSAQKARDGYTVENACFESLPGYYVCGDLYRPAETQARSHAGILNPHGHAEQGRFNDDDIASYPGRCITFARLGCVAFMWDMVDYNDSARQLAGKYQPVAYWDVHNDYWPHGRHERSLWNIGSFGLQLWNSIRALDFLSSLPEVDPDRLACTGDSGGGTQTFMLSAVDDRLTISAPVCMVSASMQGGCNCENAPGLRLETNNVDFTAISAPRPMMIVSASGDWTKETATVEFPAIRRVYELYGAADRLEHTHLDARHGYNLQMREAVYPWVLRQFGLPCDEPLHEPPHQAEAPEELLSFAAGLPENAVRSHEELVERLVASTRQMLAEYEPTSIERCLENRRVLGEGLRLSTGARLPEPDDVVYERRSVADLAGLSGEGGVLAGKARGVEVPVWRCRPEGEGSGNVTLLVHGQGKAALSGEGDLLRELLAAGHTVYAMDAFGLGAAAGEQDPAQPRGSTRYFETFNRTDDAERVYDIVLAIGFCARSGAGGDGAKTVNVVGMGTGGAWVAVAGAVVGEDAADLAALRFAIDANRFPTAVAEAYLQNLDIPGILRAGGLANATALLAPHELLLHNAGGVFDTAWVEAAYQAFRMAGHEARVTIEAGPADRAGLVASILQDTGAAR